MQQIDITEQDWKAFDALLDRIAADARENDGEINHSKFEDEVKATAVYRQLNGTDAFDVFLNTYHNGLDARLENTE